MHGAVDSSVSFCALCTQIIVYNIYITELQLASLLQCSYEYLAIWVAATRCKVKWWMNSVIHLIYLMFEQLCPACVTCFNYELLSILSMQFGIQGAAKSYIYNT